MRLHWFKRVGLFYVPIHIVGWLLLAAGAAYAVYVCISLNAKSHSVSDFLINFVFSLLIIGAVYTLIAFFTSGNNKA
jgi:hypothetical protein